MAAAAARQRQLLVLLGLLSMGVAMAAEAVDKSKEVVVDAYALVQVPGCNVGRPNSLVLPPGGLLLHTLPACSVATAWQHSGCCSRHVNIKILLL